MQVQDGYLKWKHLWLSAAELRFIGWVINVDILKPSGNFLYHHVQHSKILPLPAQCNYVFRLVDGANGNYFPCRINFCFFIYIYIYIKPIHVGSPCGTNWVRKYNTALSGQLLHSCVVLWVLFHYNFCCSWSGQLPFFLAFLKYSCVSNVHVLYFFSCVNIWMLDSTLCCPNMQSSTMVWCCVCIFCICVGSNAFTHFVLTLSTYLCY